MSFVVDVNNLELQLLSSTRHKGYKAGCDTETFFSTTGTEQPVNILILKRVLDDGPVSLASTWLTVLRQLKEDLAQQLDTLF